MWDKSLVHFKCQALQNSSKSFCKETSGVFYLMEKHPWDRGICLLTTCKTTPITWEATVLCRQITNAGLGAVSGAWPSSFKEFKLPKAIERRRKRRRIWIRFSFLLFAIKWLLCWATHSHWQTRQDGLNRERQKWAEEHDLQEGQLPSYPSLKEGQGDVEEDKESASPDSWCKDTG